MNREETQFMARNVVHGDGSAATATQNRDETRFMDRNAARGDRPASAAAATAATTPRHEEPRPTHAPPQNGGGRRDGVPSR